jgi:hypothetical protein
LLVSLCVFRAPFHLLVSGPTRAPLNIVWSPALVAQADALRNPDSTGSIGLNAPTLGGLIGGGTLLSAILAGVNPGCSMAASDSAEQSPRAVAIGFEAAVSPRCAMWKTR